MTAILIRPRGNAENQTILYTKRFSKVNFYSQMIRPETRKFSVVSRKAPFYLFSRWVWKKKKKWTIAHTIKERLLLHVGVLCLNSKSGAKMLSAIIVCATLDKSRVHVLDDELDIMWKDQWKRPLLRRCSGCIAQRQVETTSGGDDEKKSTRLQLHQEEEIIKFVPSVANIEETHNEGYEKKKFLYRLTSEWNR